MEYPEVSNGKQPVYDIDADYQVVEKAFKTIKDFHEKYRCKPDYLIVGSLTFVSIAHHYMGSPDHYVSLEGIDSFEGVRMILDPESEKDKAIAIFASPKQVLLRQVTPDELIDSPEFLG